MALVKDYEKSMTRLTAPFSAMHRQPVPSRAAPEGIL